MNQPRNFFCLFVCFVFGSLTLGHAQSRDCKVMPLTTETRWGGNEKIEIDLRDKPVRTVRGTVVWPDGETVSALVQVYLRKPSDGHYQTRYEDARLPVAACETGDDGAFAFSLAPGEYELRMSQNGGVDVTSVFLTVKHGWHRSRKIKAQMHLGT
jgi:hypothetical protein